MGNLFIDSGWIDKRTRRDRGYKWETRGMKGGWLIKNGFLFFYFLGGEGATPTFYIYDNFFVTVGY